MRGRRERRAHHGGHGASAAARQLVQVDSAACAKLSPPGRHISRPDPSRSFSMSRFSSTRRTLVSALGATGLLAAVPAVHAADAWPSKPITLVVPFSAGGTTDILARVVAQKLTDSLHQSVIVDNRGGAGGTLGAGMVARSAPDGYTLFMATIAHAIAPALYHNLPYDFIKDFEPVGLVGTVPNVLIVNNSVPAKTVPELIAYIKKHPKQVNFGSAGIGSTEHLAGELFRSMTGTEITHIPYKGGAPMMADLMGGQIQMALETAPSAAPHVRAGKVRALAVTSAQPSPAFPGVPTLSQAGVKGYEMQTWYALMAPHGTPKAIVDRLHAELEKALHLPEVEKTFAEQGVTAGNMSEAQLENFIRNETAKWGKVVKDANVKLE
jgi:tripartite-type tricarboxylate transporter receptor subunit TctC